jgi:hypothetical protein
VHTGPYLVIEPTGRQIDVRVAILAHFSDGLMAGERFYYDLATIGRQLGTVPDLVRARLSGQRRSSSSACTERPMRPPSS